MNGIGERDTTRKDMRQADRTFGLKLIIRSGHLMDVSAVEDVKMGVTEIEYLFNRWNELDHLGSSGVLLSQGNEFRASHKA
jgi:hypothetical protein